MSSSRCVVRFGKNIWQAACQHRIAMTTNVNPNLPDRAARSFGSSMTCVEHIQSRHGRGPLARRVDALMIMKTPAPPPDQVQVHSQH
jgi:acetoin utilization deacetylase AcuC-like enzyme